MIKVAMHKTTSCFMVIVCVITIIITGCAKQKTKEDMSFDELKARVGAYLKNHKYQEASEMLAEIIAKHPEREDIHKFKIILADTYFKLEQYQLAYQMYNNYWQFYPSHIRAEYSKYQAILSKYSQTLKIDCDQTLTNDTIALCKEYTADTHYKRYLVDVHEIQRVCEQKLINKEIYVFNFYLHQEQFDAAKSRLAYLKKTYLSKQPNLEAQLYYLECKLAQKKKDNLALQETYALLARCHPTSEFTHMAEALFHKPAFIF